MHLLVHRNSTNLKLLLASMVLMIGLSQPLGALSAFREGDVDQDGRLTAADVVMALRMAQGLLVADLAVADLDRDGRVTIKDVVLVARRVDNRDDDWTINPSTGGVIQAEDGASVTFPAQSSSGKIHARIEKTSDATGAVSDDRVGVSGEYLLRIVSEAPIGGSLWASLPIDESLLPAALDRLSALDGLTPEEYDPVTTTWVPIGNATWYDSDLRALFFDLQWNSATAATGVAGAGSQPEGVYPLQTLTPNQKRVRVRARQYTSLTPAHRQGSNFIIKYYAPTAGSDAVRDDLTWDSHTGYATEPGVPDYIEDLDIALNNAYTQLLTFRDSNGATIFSPESVPMSVCVQYLGSGIEGQTKLGGGWLCDLCITSSEIETWDQLRGVAGHELVHVLQGQHYSSNLHAWLFNQWFVEATANHYAARASQLNTQEKMELYGGRASLGYDRAAEYLDVSITTGSQGSMYTLAHFLDWLKKEYQSEVTANALRNGSTSDLINLGAGIQAAGGPGITSAFGDYVDEILKTPQASEGLHGAIKNRMGTLATVHLSGLPRFTFDAKNKHTFVLYKKTLNSLSAAHIRLQANNTEAALLVIDASASDDFALEWLSYPFLGNADADYAGVTPLSSGLGFRALRTSSLAVPDTAKGSPNNGLEFSLVNSGTPTNVFAQVAFYILLPPSVVQQSVDSVTWSTEGIGDIPTGYIKGYRIYRNGAALPGAELIPRESGTQQTHSLPQISGQDQIVVSVVDRFNNVWPQVTPPTPVEVTSVNPREGTVGTAVTINGTGFGAGRGGSTVTFGGSPAIDYQAWSDSRIVVNVPNGAKTGALVLRIGGQSVDAGNFTVLIHTVSSYSPLGGYPGDEVRIWGTGFGASRGNSVVTFGGIPATSYISWSDTRIEVRVPAAGVSGSLVVSVAGIDVAAGPFTVLQPPHTIIGFTPFEGRIGDQVTITGSGFGDSGFVYFAGTYSACSTWTDTLIVCTVPSGAQTGDLVVEVDDVPVVAGTFYVLAGFEITSISPPEAHVGDVVTITGTGFGNDCGDSGCYVMLGDLKIDFFWHWGPTEIRFTIPSEAISGDLWLYSEGVGVDWGRYIVRPRIWTNPDNEILWPRSIVTIQGNGFGEPRASSSVTFNGESAQVYDQWTTGTVTPYVPDVALGKDQVTVMLNVGGLSEKVGDIKVADIVKYLNEEYRSVTATVWDTGFHDFVADALDPSFNANPSHEDGLTLTDGSKLQGVLVTNNVNLWPEDPPLTWTQNASGFKFDAELTKQNQTDTWTVKIDGQIEINSYHSTIDVMAEYSFVGKISDPQLVDYSETRVLQIQGLPLTSPPAHPVLLPSGVDGYWSASGLAAQPHVVQLQYTTKRGSESEVRIATIKWESLTAKISFQKDLR